MSQVYFAATNWYLNHEGYRSHVDFFRLAELSGYPIIPVSQIDPYSDNVYIFTPVNGETQNGWNNPTARIILYALEWNIDNQHNVPNGVSEVWCGDKWHSEKYNYRYVPLGSHKLLNELYYSSESFNKQYDVSFMMYRDPPRRARVVHEFYESGLRLSPDGWGIERSRYLNQSKAMVLVHQWDNLPVLPPLRMCIAAAHRLWVLSETVQDKGIFYGFMDDIPYSQLVNTTRLIVRNPNSRLKELGESLYNLLCEDYTFRHAIERAL